MGVEEGKPAAGQEGVQSEWLYKGNCACVIALGEALSSPSFALDGGEELEIAGFYLVSKDRKAHRIGSTFGDEFSDHMRGSQNYFYLAHSKLRSASFEPELLVGELPEHIEGNSRIARDKEALWKKAFLSGEENMPHSFKNPEYHHFKYTFFRQPGDLHVDMFGTSTLLFTDSVQA